MIRTLFGLLVILGGVLLGMLWLARDLEPGALTETLPRLHTVDLNDLVDSALESDLVGSAVETLRERAASEPAPGSALEERPAVRNEERLPAPTPFVEAPLPPAEAEAPEPGTDPEPDPGELVVAARDQDAWAALIRRMLELHRRAGPR